ncbi:Isochorismatase-like protein [Xylariales sp. PMI_506]|nr:Isochorismatase-like protein [Xylariales sp. PMI_506]
MATALLIIDMQQFFDNMAKEATPNILKLHNCFSQNSLPIIFTQHGHPEEDFKRPVRNQLVRRWGAAGSIHRGSPDWELLPAIRGRVGDSPVVAKNTYDAFIGTDLEELLGKLGVRRLVICGVMTDCCCESTARSAFNRGYETWLVGDACGSANEEQHQRSLDDFNFGYGPIRYTDQVVKKLQQARL